MLVTLNEIMKDAYAKKYAVGAFNTVNLASIRAVLDAAEKLDAPVILQHAQIHESVAPLKVIGPVMLEMARAAQVPVCVHLDHAAENPPRRKQTSRQRTATPSPGKPWPLWRLQASTPWPSLSAQPTACTKPSQSWILTASRKSAGL